MLLGQLPMHIRNTAGLCGTRVVSETAGVGVLVSKARWRRGRVVLARWRSGRVWAGVCVCVAQDVPRADNPSRRHPGLAYASRHGGPGSVGVGAGRRRACSHMRMLPILVHAVRALVARAPQQLRLERRSSKGASRAAKAQPRRVGFSSQPPHPSVPSWMAEGCASP